jgi:hypothetical protein
MDSNKTVADPTDPGTLRPNLTPEPTTGSVFNLPDFPDFDHHIELPNNIDNTDAFAIWSLFFNDDILQSIVDNTNLNARYNTTIHQQ